MSQIPSRFMPSLPLSKTDLLGSPRVSRSYPVSTATIPCCGRCPPGVNTLRSLPVWQTCFNWKPNHGRLSILPGTGGRSESHAPDLRHKKLRAVVSLRNKQRALAAPDDTACPKLKASRSGDVTLARPRTLRNPRHRFRATSGERVGARREK